MDSKRPAHLKCAPVLYVGMAKLTAVGVPVVGANVGFCIILMVGKKTKLVTVRDDYCIWIVRDRRIKNVW